MGSSFKDFSYAEQQIKRAVAGVGLAVRRFLNLGDVTILYANEVIHLQNENK